MTQPDLSSLALPENPEQEELLDFAQKVIRRMRDAGYGEALLGRFWDEAKIAAAQSVRRLSGSSRGEE